MKNIQTHVYIPENQMRLIRIAAKDQVRSPQNLLTYLLLTSPHYQQLIQEYETQIKTEQSTPASH